MDGIEEGRRKGERKGGEWIGRRVKEGGKGGNGDGPRCVKGKDGWRSGAVGEGREGRVKVGEGGGGGWQTGGQHDVCTQ